jgi:hypothetical protein
VQTARPNRIMISPRCSLPRQKQRKDVMPQAFN